ncbi:phosphotransferase [Micromonospora sp. NPDC050200]|uniref:phosphotransferase enzyme family protein n=1 Tax=Micromonospora sp. NPDC050200 TaxID=3155664 RepID=UPI0033F17C55
MRHGAATDIRSSTPAGKSVARTPCRWLTPCVPAERTLRSCLDVRWGLTGALVAPHHGGMNSGTWFVEHAGVRRVAKTVSPRAGGSFAAGLAVAELLERTGVAAGAPVPTVDGQLTAEVEGRPLALLAWVPGVPLTGTDQAEQRLIGRMLARVHDALRSASVPAADRFHWLEPAADHLGVRNWVRPAVIAAVRAYEALKPERLSWGLLHSDPAPEAFRLDRSTGRCGVIDWSVALVGPLLYDVASAVMYVGGPDRARALVEAYLAGGLLGRAELDHGLATMLRLRWAIQADYFARRLVEDDRTGVAGPVDNERGLEDARRALLALR